VREVTNFRDESKRFARLAKKTCKEAKPADVHHLRALTRRLRTHLWVIPKTEQCKPILKARRDLKCLAQVLGEQRTYDVALEDAPLYGRKTMALREKRKAARKSVRKALKKRKHYEKEIHKALKEANRLSALSFLPKIEELQHQLKHSIQNPPKTSPARHRLRIAVKKARYLLENFHNALPPLKTLQDHLGRWNDLRVLSILTGHPRNLIRDREEEWQEATRILPGVLKKTDRKLAAVKKSFQNRN
jgi:CHAD domain-containing protein